MISSKQCKDAGGREHRRTVVARDEARHDPEAAVGHHGDARHAARPAEWCLGEIALVRQSSAQITNFDLNHVNKSNHRI